MPLYQAIVLGLVQGVTEFLPISSTAHLILIPWLLGWRDPGLRFDVALHLGTFLAVAAYFRAELGRVFSRGIALFFRPAPSRDPDQKLALLLILGTIPAAVAGVLFEKEVEGALRSPAVVGFALLGVAFVLAAVDRASLGTRGIRGAGYGDAIAIGIAQAAALIPGVSRSGATIAMGLGVGLTREAAARFSFLLGVPTIAGGCIFKLKDLAHARGAVDWTSFLVGVFASAATGYLAIHWLLSYVRRSSFCAFVFYRIALGAIVLFLALGRRI
jgi:undecaprenyl-diphosphatase